MSFTSDLDRFARKVEGRTRRIAQISREEVQRSIVEGSELTSAPGQPVQFGTLKGSWVPRFINPYLWEISTPLLYAPFIEEGFYKQRSPVGGPHNIKLTRGGWQRIVSFAQREVVRG